MLSLAEAQATLWQQAVPVAQSHFLPLDQALGAIAARPVMASLAVPPADNSAMDGYALRLAEACAPLPVCGRIAAGVALRPWHPAARRGFSPVGKFPVAPIRWLCRRIPKSSPMAVCA